MLKKSQKKEKNKLFAGLLIILIIMISSCGTEQNKPIKVNFKSHNKKIQKKIKVNNKKKISKKINKFVYSVNEIKRDPFSPFIKIIPEKEAMLPELEERIVTPLTEYSLDQYKLVGIITDSKPPLAMVETSDKKGLIFTVGEYIGSEYFKVVKIKENLVMLQKKYLTYDKKIKIEEKILKIDLLGE